MQYDIRAGVATIGGNVGARLLKIAEVPNTSDEGEANARLITAAPELLGALKGIAALDEGDEPFAWTHAPEFDAVHDAIAKAEGR